MQHTYLNSTISNVERCLLMSKTQDTTHKYNIHYNTLYRKLLDCLCKFFVLHSHCSNTQRTDYKHKNISSLRKFPLSALNV